MAATSSASTISDRPGPSSGRCGRADAEPAALRSSAGRRRRPSRLALALTRHACREAPCAPPSRHPRQPRAPGLRRLRGDRSRQQPGSCQRPGARLAHACQSASGFSVCIRQSSAICQASGAGLAAQRSAGGGRGPQRGERERAAHRHDRGALAHQALGGGRHDRHHGQRHPGPRRGYFTTRASARCRPRARPGSAPAW